jgi:hypothetical protein
MLQIAHIAADRGRRQIMSQALRKRLRSDRLTGLEIGGDKSVENLQRAWFQAQKGGVIHLFSLG